MKTKNDFKKLLRLNKLPEFENLTESQKSLVSEEEYRKVAFILPPNWKIRITQNSKRFLDKWRSSGTLSSTEGFIRSPDGYFGDGEHNGLPEITLEQFKKYVLNEKSELF